MADEGAVCSGAYPTDLASVLEDLALLSCNSSAGDLNSNSLDLGLASCDNGVLTNEVFLVKLNEEAE